MPLILRHVTTPDNTEANWTRLEMRGLDENPLAIVVATHVWNAPDTVPVANPHPIAVEYAAGRWRIVNTDGAPMPVLTAFNVSTEARPTRAMFVHTTTPANTFGNTTSIDSGDANGRPEAAVFATPRVSYAGSGGPALIDVAEPGLIGTSYGGAAAHKVGAFETLEVAPSYGTWYNTRTNHWNIFVPNKLINIPIGLRFNVEVLTVDNYPSYPEHVRFVIADGTSGNYADFLIEAGDNPATRMFVMQNISARFNTPRRVQGPRDARPAFNDHPVGLWFNPRTGRPSIFNEDRAPLERGTGFSVRHYY